ncbi:hypothetical protein AB0B66_38335 [Catellatospora sp. NPDC049111]|uniref:hypothetical protein n=1 Tax=Catellatospora sp. NPDC049111 TaxID=3155271 RepID=UPI0033CE74CE
MADEFAGLPPWRGLRRGAVVSVTDSAMLLLALIGQASAQGSWCAAVGYPSLGMAAAAESGVALDRFALVPHPGDRWADVAAALIDGFDVVILAPPTPPGNRLAASLTARARQRGTVLLPPSRTGRVPT